MSTKHTTASLDQRILMLKDLKARQWAELQEQFDETKESLKPINLIKSTFSGIASNPEVKTNIVGNVVGLATGYLSRKIIFGSSHGLLKKVAGAALQFAVTKFIGKKVEQTVAENTDHAYGNGQYQ